MNRSDWVWMPHPAHFICARDCRFVLATYVGGYIVSTVGEYWPDRDTRRVMADSLGVKIKGRGDEYDAAYFKKFGYEQIGLDRKYETMVFKAAPSDPDSCCPYRIDSGQEQELKGYNDPEEAYKGHLELCRKWGEK